jgi:hypothetical protein
MSTELIGEDKHEGFLLTRLYGGKDRGTCYQITTSDGYVQLTTVQMRTLLMAFCAEMMGVTES